MTKLSELRQALGVAEDELKVMRDEASALVNAGGPAYDAKYAASVAQREKIDRIKRDIAETEDSIQRQAALAGPVLEESRRAIAAGRRPLYSGLRAFKDYKDDKGNVVRADEQAYRVGQFILAAVFQSPEAAEYCKANGIMLTRAQAEGVNSAGGFLVPEEMMASIIDLRELFGVFRRESFIAPMGRDTLNWPRRTGGVTAYFVAEGIAPTESTATWDNVNLTAKKLAALVRLSTEIAEDAIINVADWIVQEIAYAFSSKEDDCGFSGDGTSTYGGIRGLSVLFADGTHTAGLYTATGHASFAAIDATDLTSLMGLLPYYALPNAKFYCSQFAFASTIERLVATAGGNSIATLDGSISYRYLGFPVVVSQKMQGASSPSGKIGFYFGDLRKAAALGERRQVSIKRSDERYFDTDQIGLMGTERVDINVHDIGDTTNAGPLVALKLG